MSVKKVTGRAAVVSLQKIEDWINSQENSGEILLAMGAIDQQTYDRGYHQLEDFRVVIEADPENVPQDAFAAFREVEGVDQIGQKTEA